MKIRRFIAAAVLAAGFAGASSSTAVAAPKKCPPGHEGTAVIEVIGIELVTTFRVL